MSPRIPPRPAGAAAVWITRLLRRRRPGVAEVRALADPARVRAILVVKPHDQLGDFVVATPFLTGLRERYPQARIVLVTREFLAPLARRAPGLDEILVVPRMDGPGAAVAALGVFARAAALRPDLAFVLNSVSRSKTADAIAAWSRARAVIGRSRVGAGALPDDAPANPADAAFQDPRRDAVYDLDLPIGAQADHQTDRLIDLARWCGAIPSSLALTLRVDNAEADEARGELLRAFFPGPAPAVLVGIHPGAANPIKCWPLDAFVDLGCRLGAEPGLGLAVFDAPREAGRAAAVHAGLVTAGVPAVLIPPGTIDRFTTRCRPLDLLICNDSGVMHIAAALGVPTLSLHSLGRLSEWAPRNEMAVAFRGVPDIGAIPVVAAAEAAKLLLRRRREGSR